MILCSRLPIIWSLWCSCAIVVLLVILEPPDEEITEVFEYVPMQLLQCPILPCPNQSRQIKFLHTLKAMYDDFHPVRANPHIRISLRNLFYRWQNRIELIWNLKEKHNATSLVSCKLLNSLLAVENMLHCIVLYPGNDEAARFVAILLLHHQSQIIQIVLIVYSEPNFVILIGLIQLILE